MPANQGQWDGAAGFKNGNPKRQMQTIPLATLDPTTAVTGEPASQLVGIFLNGLTGNLKVALGVSLERTGTSQNSPLDLPAGAVQIQLYPYTNNGRKIYARPVFQDPTNVTGANAPQVKDAPFVWEGPFTEADGILMEVTISPAAFAGFNQTGNIVAVATVEYNGSWWDVTAFVFALANVQWEGQPAPIKLPCAGGG